MSGAAANDAPAAARAALAARFRDAGLDWIIPQWPAPAGVHAFFTTRNGDAKRPLDVGASRANTSQLPQSYAVGSLRLVASYLPAAPRWLEQVHGTDIAVFTHLPADVGSGSAPRADAAVTREAGVVLAVRVADCLPVRFRDRAGTTIGVAHAGWRGLAAGVLENTVAALGASPSDLVAWLGPAIGPAAFEVGDDVRDAFVRDDPDAARAFAAGRPGKWHADLEGLARHRLARAGVTDVTPSGLCTASDAARFFSYRRDGATGRMAVFIWRSRA
jgi:YfiH family protein